MEPKDSGFAGVRRAMDAAGQPAPGDMPPARDPIAPIPAADPAPAQARPPKAATVKVAEYFRVNRHAVETHTLGALEARADRDAKLRDLDALLLAAEREWVATKARIAADRAVAIQIANKEIAAHHGLVAMAQAALAAGSTLTEGEE